MISSAELAVTDMDSPQFKTAEYSGAKSGDRCKLCSQPLGAAYWRVGQAMACQACAENAKNDQPKDTHSAYSRALLFGIGGAIVGLAIYATFAIVTGIILGYVSLAVGYIVGKAMSMGSKGLGGRRYQITAVILTYAAVSMAAIPIGITQVVKQRQAQRRAHAQQATVPRAGSNSNVTELPLSQSNNASSNDSPAPIPSVATPESANQMPSPVPAPARAPRHVNYGLLILALLYAGLASPFLELFQSPVQGLIGLVILLVGIRIAWQITGGPTTPAVSGPFKNAAVAATPAPQSLG
jgi:hypothetical protein